MVVVVMVMLVVVVVEGMVIDGDGGGDPSNTRSLSLLSARGIDSSAKDRVRLSA